MAERITLRSLLYLVFGWSLLATFASMTRPGGSPGEPAMIAFIALCALAISAYDPRYSPWVEPPPKRPRED